MSTTLGVEPDQLTAMARAWRHEATEVDALSWTATTEATGDGSAVLAAMRGLAEPAGQAMTSIADRYTALADLVEQFSADIQARDAEIAGAIDALRAR